MGDRHQALGWCSPGIISGEISVASDASISGFSHAVQDVISGRMTHMLNECLEALKFMLPIFGCYVCTHNRRDTMVEEMHVKIPGVHAKFT